MTFDDIVDMVCLDLNITSPSSITRVGTHVNRRYQQVMDALGMNVFARVSFDLELEPGTRTQTLDETTTPVVQRIVSLYRQGDASDNLCPLDELTFEEMQHEIPGTGDATKWSRVRMGPTSTTFMLNSTVPDGQTLMVEGEEHASVLADDDVPAFTESFHDVLVFGAKADELRKMEKFPLAKEFEGDERNPSGSYNFQGRLAQLRLKSILMQHGNIVQGKQAARARRPWQVR